MMAYRHGFRASELVALRWDQIDLKAGTLHVARLKHGSPSTRPLRGPELRALRSWKREQGAATKGDCARAASDGNQRDCWEDRDDSACGCVAWILG